MSQAQQIAQLREEIGTLKNITDTFNAKFTNLDQEAVSIKEHLKLQEPKFNEYDKMASTWKNQVGSIL